jgi:uncharacterized protein YecE (DUF72 family)
VARLLIGTSGWTYSSWKGVFYPKELPSRGYLEFYSRKFDSTEVNYSFYHLPRPSTYQKWAEQVPEQFVFALKASRFITHVKRLVDVEEAWTTFVHNALALGSHLGPVLLQFSPSFRGDRKKLADFMKFAQRPAPKSHPLRLVFEFRHDSWFTEAILSLLRRHNGALCIADSPRYPRCDEVTADFVYMRFHGRTELFASKYTDAELAKEAKRIRRYLRDGLDVYVYFNNDALGHAVANARTIGRLVRGEGPPLADSAESDAGRL